MEIYKELLNRKKAAKKICELLNSKQYVNVLVCAKTQSGKTGIMSSLILNYIIYLFIFTII